MVTVTVDPSNIVAINRLQLGVQLETFHPTPHSPPPEMDFKMIRFHTFRAGAVACTNWNDATKTGSWDWTNAERYISAIENVGAESMLSLGRGYGDQNQIPGMSSDPATGLPYLDSWAAYSREWIRHFKGRVHFVETFNEPWLFFGWNDQPQLDDFLELFDVARLAMKAEDPTILVGFDGTNRRPVLDRLIDLGIELDFISFHKYDSGTAGGRTLADMLNRAEIFQMKTSSSYYGIKDARAIYYSAMGKELPVMCTEINTTAQSVGGTDPMIQQMEGTVWNALQIRTGMIEGLDYDIYFHWKSSKIYQEKVGTGYGFGMVNSDNNQPWYPYLLYRMIWENLAFGDPICSTSSNDSRIRAISWKNGNIILLLINKSLDDININVEGIVGDLTYRKLSNAIHYDNAAEQTGVIDASSTITLNGLTVMLLSTPSPFQHLLSVSSDPTGIPFKVSHLL